MCVCVCVCLYVCVCVFVSFCVCVFNLSGYDNAASVAGQVSVYVFVLVCLYALMC